VIALLSVAAARGVGAQHTQAVRDGWPVAATASIKLHVASGAVELVGWARDSVHLQGDMADGERLFALGAPDGLKLGAEGRTVRGESRLTVFVPATAEVTVRSGSAAVRVRDVRGTLDIGAAAGDVDVRGAPTVCRIDALAGHVRVTGSAGALQVRTSRGNIAVAASVRDAQLETVSGSVEVSATELPALRITSVSGNVRVSSARALRAAAHVETFGGDVLIERPATGAAERLQSDTGPVMRDGVRLAPELGVAASSTGLLTVRSFRGAITVRAPRP
jgi:hypothetical protein